jgi:hypothetical protein
VTGIHVEGDVRRVQGAHTRSHHEIDRDAEFGDALDEADLDSPTSAVLVAVRRPFVPGSAPFAWIAGEFGMADASRWLHRASPLSGCRSSGRDAHRIRMCRCRAGPA